MFGAEAPSSKAISAQFFKDSLEAVAGCLDNFPVACFLLFVLRNVLFFVVTWAMIREVAVTCCTSKATSHVTDFPVSMRIR